MGSQKIKVEGELLDKLKTIGIEKGKPFNPDQQTQDTLAQAARVAHEWLDAGYESLFLRLTLKVLTGLCRSTLPKSTDNQISMLSRTFTRSSHGALLTRWPSLASSMWAPASTT